MSYTFVSFNVPGAVRTEPLSVTENGQIVGLFVDAAGVTHGFFDGDGVIHTIDDPLGISTVAAGINDPGRITGYYIDQNGLAHAFFDDKGSFTTLNDPASSNGTFAQGINEPGGLLQG
jgi:uncharacterized membrane protein